MTLRTLGLALAAALAIGAAGPAFAQEAMPKVDEGAQPVFPWYLDPEEIGPLYAQTGDTTRALSTYAGDEDAGDFAARYGCKPVWDGGVNRLVPTCNAP